MVKQSFEIRKWRIQKMLPKKMTFERHPSLRLRNFLRIKLKDHKLECPEDRINQLRERTLIELLFHYSPEQFRKIIEEMNK